MHRNRWRKRVSPAYCSFLVAFWFGKIHCQRSVFGFVFLGFVVGSSLESEFEFAAEFFAVGKIELVFFGYSFDRWRIRQVIRLCCG